MPEQPNPDQQYKNRDYLESVEVYASGGLGVIKKACDSRFGRTVAIKEIRDQKRDDVNARQRFLREAEITGKLDHPGIVPVYNIDFDDDDHPYYVMKFVDGITLREAIDQYHESPSANGLRDLLQKLISVCQTIAFANSRGIVHRDLKPSNIILGEFGQTLVVDWGLARELDQDDDFDLNEAPEEETEDDGTLDKRPMEYTVTKTGDASVRESENRLTELGAVIGTPTYMSPEQASGLDVDQRSDIYSIGSILYVILCGQPPYSAETSQQIIQKVRSQDPPRPSLRANDVPKPLEAICMRAMSRTINDRYSNANLVAEDLNQWLADEPIEIYADPLSTRIRRWIKSHQTTTVSVAVLLLTSLVGLILSVILVSNQKNKTDQALDTALRRREQTRKALESMTSTVAEDWLLQKQELTDADRAFLNRVIEMYSEFGDELEGDQDSTAELAEAHRRIAGIYRAIGDSEKSQQRFEKAIEAYQSLHEKDPDDKSIQFNLAKVHGDLASMLGRFAKNDVAKSHIDSAESLLKELLESDQSNPDYLSQIVSVRVVRAELEWETGNPKVADETLVEAIQLSEKLCQGPGTPTRYLRQLAKSKYQRSFLQYRHPSLGNKHFQLMDDVLKIQAEILKSGDKNLNDEINMGLYANDLGVYYKVEGDYEKAEELYRQAVSIRGQLASRYPNNVSISVGLGGSYLNLGNLLRIQKKFDESFQWYDEGIQFLERILLIDPRRKRGRRFLRNLYEGRAESSMALKRFDKAAEDWKRGLELNSSEWELNDTHFDVRLGLRLQRAQLELGPVKNAIESAETILREAEKSDRGQAHYSLAAVYSGAARKDIGREDQYQKIAVHHLKQALELGFHRNGPLAVNFDQDPDFENLKSRDDFKQLVSEFKAKQKNDNQ